MSEQRYNIQTITQYLLGSLPEAEAERFDALSVADDEFAAALQAAEKDLIDAYVQGELSGAALEHFKSYYLASPLRHEKVDFAQAFRLYAEKSATAPQKAAGAYSVNPDRATTKRKGTGFFSALSVLVAPRPALQWGFAALTLALLVAGGWLVSENVRLRQQVSQTGARRDASGQREQELQKELEGRRTAGEETQQKLARARAERERLEQELKQQETRAQQQAAGQRRAGEQSPPAQPSRASVASFILAPQLRGAGQMQTLSVPAKTDYVALRLELEPNDYPAYRVALLDQSDNRILWRSNKLKAKVTSDGKTLSIRFPAGLLSPQVYALRVSGVSANGASEIFSEYPFRVVK